MSIQGKRAAIRAYFDRNVDEWDTLRYRDEAYLGRGRLALGWLRRMGRGKRVLDLGCGTGRQTLGALHDGDAVVATDFSYEMARATRDRIRRELSGAVPAVVVSDALHPPFRPGSFDAVMALGLVGFVDDRPRLVRELRALLRPDGELVCDAGVPEERVLLHAAGEAVSRPLRAAGRWLREKVLRRTLPPPAERGFYWNHFVKHAPAEFDTLLEQGRFEPVARGGAGFGELRVLGRHLLPWRVEMWLGRNLDRLSALRGGGFLARHAMIYVVRAVRLPDIAPRREKRGAAPPTPDAPPLRRQLP